MSFLASHSNSSSSALSIWAEVVSGDLRPEIATVGVISFSDPPSNFSLIISLEPLPGSDMGGSTGLTGDLRGEMNSTTKLLERFLSSDALRSLTLYS